MSQATLERELSRLDAIGRARALTEVESLQLERLVRIAARKVRDRSRYAERCRVTPTDQRTAKPAAPIADRLDATIARMSLERLLVRAIYLTAADRAELDASGVLAGDPDAPTFRGYPVRKPKSIAHRSIIYTRHGVARAVRSTGA